jgi:hypothetical protein
MVGDGTDLRELCGRVAKEEDPVKLRQLIAELSQLLQTEGKRRESQVPTAESGSQKKLQNPTP